MRWYVSRSGETIGPVDEGQVVQWYQAGMRDAMVRDEAGGPWTPIAQSPFGAGLGLQLAHAPPVGACRTCGAFGTKQVKSSISTGGWVLFFVMLLICLPVALVGLFMRDQYSICAHCGSRAWG